MTSIRGRCEELSVNTTGPGGARVARATGFRGKWDPSQDLCFEPIKIAILAENKEPLRNRMTLECISRDELLSFFILPSFGILRGHHEQPLLSKYRIGQQATFEH